MVDKMRCSPEKLLELLRLSQQLSALLIRQRVRRRWGRREHDFGLCGSDGGHDRQSRLATVAVVRREAKKEDKVLVAGYTVKEGKSGPSGGVGPPQGGYIPSFQRQKELSAPQLCHENSGLGMMRLRLDSPQLLHSGHGLHDCVSEKKASYCLAGIHSGPPLAGTAGQ